MTTSTVTVFKELILQDIKKYCVPCSFKGKAAIRSSTIMLFGRLFSKSFLYWKFEMHIWFVVLKILFRKWRRIELKTARLFSMVNKFWPLHFVLFSNWPSKTLNNSYQKYDFEFRYEVLNIKQQKSVFQNNKLKKS